MKYSMKLQQHQIPKKCETLDYVKPDGTKVMKPKRGYNTDKEAIEVARKMNLRERQIHKMVAYKCPYCNLWHVGKNHTVLTEKDREKYRKNKIILNK